MTKLLSDKELENELIDMLEPHYWNQGFGYGDEAKEAVKKSATFRVLRELIHIQMKMKTELVIGSNHTKKEYNSVASKFGTNPYLGLQKLSIMAAEDDLRDRQRRLNK